MLKRRKFVPLDDERDIDSNQDYQSSDPETLLIALEEKIEADKRHQKMAILLEKAVLSLPKLQRSIIIIRYYEQGEDRYTAQQTAKALGVSRKTYYNQLNQALITLENLLKSETPI